MKKIEKIIKQKILPIIPPLGDKHHYILVYFRQVLFSLYISHL